MSFRLEMLQVARLSPTLLGDSAGLVEKFFLSQMNADGGFRDRDGKSDLYYTVFGLEGLMALRADPPLDAIRPFLEQHGNGDGLDFVHLSCLLRCWSACGGLTPERARTIGEKVSAFRTPDGGFNQKAGAEKCSAYGCLLGWSALQDAGMETPEPSVLAGCLAALKSQDGGYANEVGLPFGTTPATAAAVALHRHLRMTADPSLGTWLLHQAAPEGGFKAFPNSPIPDLLSTAVTLHALDGLQAEYKNFKEPCLDFIDTLWSADGGFHGTWADDFLDCEYTYYGLLALGHLSL